MTQNTHLTTLQENGFVVIPSLLTSPEITRLREAANNATTLTRSGSWAHFRTVPKQFPPWPKTPPPASEGGIWGVQHLLHPEMPGREEFARFYFSERVLRVVEGLLGVSSSSSCSSTTTKGGKKEEEEEEEEPLVMELFNLLVAPETKDFELRWHRDDIPDMVSAEEEKALLEAKSPQGKQFHAQYNLALCPDSSLVVVPGSHRRVRTEEERNADRYAAELPGQLVVELQPGDAVFYDSNILHRGVYKAKLQGGEESRLTLHGSVGLNERGGSAPENNKDKKVRATAVLQHGVGAWVQREDAKFGIGERPERMRANLVAMGTGEGVGYSLQG
ncbi:phytanoyl-CoA dioxygenase family protein [Aspergillus rambellii]|uniref:Phytanoyl-CoA dioxygenase family protein n=1 Tax=Aspergillus rambellii TaxID=308745 RepID=A0A0F8WUI9_9EURO|nr:phytanoyl-CoA dioxygenase family protein [Aspergillus rambellii]